MSVEQKPASGMAIASMILGIVGIFCGGIICGIPAICLGHAALVEINKGMKDGRGMAVAGLSLGYVIVAATILGLIIIFGGCASGCAAIAAN